MTPGDTSVLVKASRFGVTGVAATLLHVITALVCLRGYGAHPVFANGLAFLVANTGSYFLNTQWSFGQAATSQNFVRFAVISVLGFSLSLLISGGAHALGLPDFVGLALVVIVLPPATFLAHLLWTYK